MLALRGSRVSFNMTFKMFRLLSRVTTKCCRVTLCTHFATKRMKCCEVMWCDVWSDVMLCEVICDVWSDVMLCEMICDVWSDVTFCGVMWCDVMWSDADEFWVPLSQCWVISSMDATFLWKQRLQTTNLGQRIGSRGRTRHRRTTKGRSIHNSSWFMDIGWQQWKVSLALYIFTNGGTTIYR
jgi:hypothetical protein